MTSESGSCGDELTTAMHDIVRRHLGADVELDANFFDEGGNSLLAMMVVAEIAEEVGVDIPLVSLFEAETIGEFIAGARRPSVGA